MSKSFGGARTMLVHDKLIDSFLNVPRPPTPRSGRSSLSRYASSRSLPLRDHPFEADMYSNGWSSVSTASRFSFASSDGPFGTAQLFSTPSSSSRRP